MSAGALDSKPSETHATANGPSLSLPVSADAATGHLQVAVLASGSNYDWPSAPAGWANYEAYKVGSNWGPSLAVRTRARGAGDGASYAFPYATSHYLAGKLLSFPAGSPIKAAHGQTALKYSLGDLVLPQLTEVSAGKLLAVIAQSRPETSGGLTLTPPAGMEEIGTKVVTTSMSLAAYIGDMPAGNTGSRTFTVTGDGYVGYSIGFLVAIAGA